MSENPLHESFDLYERLIESQGDIMHAVKGCAAFDPFDEELSGAAWDLIVDSWQACQRVSPRARRARLNAIWRDFMRARESKQKNTEGESVAKESPLALAR